MERIKKPIKTTNILIEHYKWIEAQLNKYEVTFSSSGKFTSMGQPTPKNQIVCWIRSDFAYDFPTVTKKEVNHIMFTVLGDLIQKAKFELEKK